MPATPDKAASTLHRPSPPSRAPGREPVPVSRRIRTRRCIPITRGDREESSDALQLVLGAADAEPAAIRCRRAAFDVSIYRGGSGELAGAYTTETFGYNFNGQITSMGWSTPSSLGPSGSLQYNFSSTQNNGQITQVTDALSEEVVTYQYDSLKRLTSASSAPAPGYSTTPWTQTFQ